MAKFVKVKCVCGNEQIIFETASMDVSCNKCGKTLARATGGRVALEKGVAYIGDVE